jgi:hypothetical protein
MDSDKFRHVGFHANSCLQEIPVLFHCRNLPAPAVAPARAIEYSRIRRERKTPRQMPRITI